MPNQVLQQYAQLHITKKYNSNKKCSPGNFTITFIAIADIYQHFCLWLFNRRVITNISVICWSPSLGNTQISHQKQI